MSSSDWIGVSVKPSSLIDFWFGGIGIAGGHFSGALTLRLKLAQGVKNVGMVRIDDVAADPGCSCKSGDRWRGGRVFGKDAKGFAQTCIGVRPATGLRGG